MPIVGQMKTMKKATSMKHLNLELAEELAKKSNRWLDLAHPWIPFWSGFCLWRAEKYTTQLTELAKKGVREALGE